MEEKITKEKIMEEKIVENTFLENKKKEPSPFLKGLKDAVPVMLVYFAVSFSFGMMASNCGLTAIEASVMSLTNLTSAGQFAGLNIIASNGMLFELFLSQAVINLRYMLMSLSLAQKYDPKEPLGRRLVAAHGITDEIFAIAVAQPEPLSAYYSIGAMCMAAPGWVAGTFLGAALGNILPESIVACLSIAIYAMFIGIIVPPAKKNEDVCCAVMIAVVISSLLYYCPGLKEISSGFAVIITTVVTSAICALLFQNRKVKS